jgi:hypothetical protein
MQTGCEFFYIDIVSAVYDPAAHSVGTDKIGTGIAPGQQFALRHIEGFFGVFTTEQFPAEESAGSRFVRKHPFRTVDDGNEQTMLIDSSPSPAGLLIDTANGTRTT